MRLVRVGESITGSAGTVHPRAAHPAAGQLRPLPRPRGPAGRRRGGHAGARPDPAPGPAGHSRTARLLALADRARDPARGRLGPGGRPPRPARPATTLARGGARVPGPRGRGARATSQAVSGAPPPRPRARTRRPATPLLARHFPQTSSNPANLVIRLSRAAVAQPGTDRGRRGRVLRASGAFTLLAGPLDPIGVGSEPAQLAALHAQLGPPQRLPVAPPPERQFRPRSTTPTAPTALFISADGRTIQFEAVPGGGFRRTRRRR